MTVVLDADVLIGALDSTDVHHDHSRGLFRRWRRAQTTLLVSVVNLSEVLVAPAANSDRLRLALEAITALGVTIRDATERVGVDAARFRVRYPISLADGYCLATARVVGASVASFDAKVARAARAERIPITPSLFGR
ncbi:MAG TPA: PIN domain-containing protein [Candidatus Dormibacteraeota bacterium]